MNPIKHYIKWIGMLVLVVVIIFTAFHLIGIPWENAASASSDESTNATTAQLAAIQGAQQLLLLQPINSPTIYLPLISR